MLLPLLVEVVLSHSLQLDDLDLKLRFQGLLRLQKPAAFSPFELLMLRTMMMTTAGAAVAAAAAQNCCLSSSPKGFRLRTNRQKNTFWEELLFSTDSAARLPGAGWLAGLLTRSDPLEAWWMVAVCD